MNENNSWRYSTGDEPWRCGCNDVNDPTDYQPRGSRQYFVPAKILFPNQKLDPINAAASYAVCAKCIKKYK